MKVQQFSKLDLPDFPGVYIFRDARKRPLYIGRATSLHDRAKSYFSAGIIETRGPRIVDMVTKAKSLSWQETDSVLEAVILESALIKKYQPYYNIDERDDKSSLYVVITDEKWPRVFLERARDFEKLIEAKALPYEVKKYFGPYPHSGLIKEALRILRRLFPFKDKKAQDPRHEEFYRSIGRSPRDGSEDDKRKYRKTIDWLILFFEGKKELLKKRLKKEMAAHAAKLEFEEAQNIKKLLYAMDHINDMALIKGEAAKNGAGFRNGMAFRIEAYDVAHFGGTDVVGAMAVSNRGEFAPSEYRKFKISLEKNDDIAGLVEIISRRLNHSEWQYPDIIVVDGNETHKKAAESVLQSRRIAIPVVAVIKDDRHRAARLAGSDGLIKEYAKEIIALNAEAHRFAIAYHRRRRRGTMLG